MISSCWPLAVGSNSHMPASTWSCTHLASLPLLFQKTSSNKRPPLPVPLLSPHKTKHTPPPSPPKGLDAAVSPIQSAAQRLSLSCLALLFWPGSSSPVAGPKDGPLKEEKRSSSSRTRFLSNLLCCVHPCPTSDSFPHPTSIDRTAPASKTLSCLGSHRVRRQSRPAVFPFSALPNHQRLRRTTTTATRTRQPHTHLSLHSFTHTSPHILFLALTTTAPPFPLYASTDRRHPPTFVSPSLFRPSALGSWLLASSLASRPRSTKHDHPLTIVDRRPHQLP